MHFLGPGRRSGRFQLAGARTEQSGCFSRPNQQISFDLSLCRSFLFKALQLVILEEQSKARQGILEQKVKSHSSLAWWVIFAVNPMLRASAALKV